jgi:hypothetical protein
MRRALVAIVLVVTLAGCTVPLLPGDDAEPLDEGIGEVDGVTYDEEISVTTEDGLNETELDTVVDRSMARIEVIRGLKFKEEVEVTVRTRAEYREIFGGSDVDDTHRAWENTVWEAEFIVGEDRDVTAAIDNTLGEAVQGYYSSATNEIVVITDNETARVSTETLVHELVHALQDQHFVLNEIPERQDPSMARDGVVEGEASLLTERYFERCEGEWSCLKPPESTEEQSDIDPGIIFVILHPYQQGPEFVESILDRSGWEGVGDLHSNYPGSTAQIIKPEQYPDGGPANVTVDDSSADNWEPIEHDPVRETVGEAAIFVMFQHNEVISVEEPYSYSHPVSNGWSGDELLPYRNGDGETGYVWQLEWETTEDAEEFADAYHDLLAQEGAQERGQREFVIPEGPFAGAFDVRQDGTTVTVVHGPTIESLDELHDFEE